MEWSDIFYFDGEKILWAIKKANCVDVGSPAGGVNVCGYLRVQINNKYYYNHRIIW